MHLSTSAAAPVRECSALIHSLLYSCFCVKTEKVKERGGGLFSGPWTQERCPCSVSETTFLKDPVKKHASSSNPSPTLTHLNTSCFNSNTTYSLCFYKRAFTWAPLHLACASCCNFCCYRGRWRRWGRYRVYAYVCIRVCVGLGRVSASHRCTVGDVTLHIDFTVSGHRAIYLGKCFSMVHLQRGCGGTFEGMNM